MPVKLIECLATTRPGERGTMTLPKEYRDALHLELPHRIPAGLVHQLTTGSNVVVGETSSNQQPLGGLFVAGRLELHDLAA